MLRSLFQGQLHSPKMGDGIDESRVGGVKGLLSACLVSAAGFTAVVFSSITVLCPDWTATILWPLNELPFIGMADTKLLTCTFWLAAADPATEVAATLVEARAREEAIATATQRLRPKYSKDQSASCQWRQQQQLGIPLFAIFLQPSSSPYDIQNVRGLRAPVCLTGLSIRFKRWAVESGRRRPGVLQAFALTGKRKRTNLILRPLIGRKLADKGSALTADVRVQ